MSSIWSIFRKVDPGFPSENLAARHDLGIAQPDPVRRSVRHALEFSREGVHAARAGRRDLDGLREHAAGLALTPTWVEQVDVEGEHHARLNAITDDLDRLAVGCNRMVAKARIFQRCQPMAVDACFADRKAMCVDLVFHGHERGRYRLPRTEVLESAPIRGEAPFINPELLFLRLAEAVGALDMREVAAVLGVHFADDEIAFLHPPYRRHPERMR